MLTAEARIENERPSRYLVQLCRHASEMRRHRRYWPRGHGGGGAPPEVLDVEWSDTHGRISFDFGRCSLSAGADTLTVRAEAADEENLERLQTLLAARLETIGRRDQLTVVWQRVGPTPDAPGEATGGTRAPTRKGRGPWKRVVLIAAVALVVAVHVGLGAGLVAWPWAGWAADAVLVVVAAMVVAKLIAVTVLGLRRRRSRAREWDGPPHPRQRCGGPM